MLNFTRRIGRRVLISIRQPAHRRGAFTQEGATPQVQNCWAKISFEYDRSSLFPARGLTSRAFTGLWGCYGGNGLGLVASALALGQALSTSSEHEAASIHERAMPQL